MPRYVLLRHELPPHADRASHWDFMLEHEGVLWTWALENLPAHWLGQLGMHREDESNEVAAKRLADHRPEYLVLEGPVSDGRGILTRVAEGEYEQHSGEDSPIRVELRGTLTGRAILTRHPAIANEWLLAVKL